MANLIEKIKDRRAPAPETPERRDVPVAHPDPQQGLTSAQVRERADAGWTNAPVDPPGKTVKQIVLSNIFTYFYMLFFLLALCVIAVQQWLNLTFMGVIIVNSRHRRRAGRIAGDTVDGHPQGPCMRPRCQTRARITSSSECTSPPTWPSWASKDR